MVDGADAMGQSWATARPLNLRPPAPGETLAARRLHARELPADGSRSPERSVERYHRAFSESPHATALVAVEDRKASVVGFLLGSLDAAGHRAFVLRRHGVWIAGQALVRAVRGLVADEEPCADLRRAPLGGLDPGARPPATREYGRGTRTGNLACVVVDRRWRGLGVGAALVRAYETQARRACLDGLVAAAHGWPEAAPFLARLGWRPEDATTGLTPTGEDGERTAAASAAFYARRLPGRLSSGC